jgi:hypothetical protein
MKTPLFASRRLRSLVIMMLLSSSFLIATSRAEGAELKDIVVTNTRDHLLLYLKVTDCFTEDMKKAIDNGINITFTFFIRLYKVRSFWWDRKIADLKISHDIQYDSLKKVYMVRLGERNEEIISVKDLDGAMNLMSEISGVKVAKLYNLSEGSRYQVRMMAELDKIRLPLYLDYVFFFLSLWDFKTDWYTVDFTY